MNARGNTKRIEFYIEAKAEMLLSVSFNQWKSGGLKRQKIMGR